MILWLGAVQVAGDSATHEVCFEKLLNCAAPVSPPASGPGGTNL